MPTKKKNENKVMDLLRVTRKTGEACLTLRQRETFKGLGLSKRHRTVLLEDTNSVRGMVNKVITWVDVQVIAAKDSKAAWEQLAKSKQAKKPDYRVVAAR